MRQIITVFILLFFIISCGTTQNKTKNTKTDPKQTKNTVIMRNTTENTRSVTLKTATIMGEVMKTGNVDLLDQVIGEGYIQHSANAKNGLSGLKEFFTGFGEKFPEFEFEPKGIYADGDLSFFLSFQKYNKEHQGVMVLDIWRVDGEKLEEHWAVTQDVVKSKLHDNEMVFNYVANGKGDTETSRKTAQICFASIGEVMTTGNMEALDKVIPEDYIQHDPVCPDGLSGLKAFFGNIGKSYPEYSFEPKGIFSDGDIVFFLSSQKYTKEHAGVFVVDIWRIEDEKVVEHWDITEGITTSEFHNNEMIFDYKQK